MVAGQDRDPLPGDQSVLPPAVGDRIAASVELLVADHAELVDDRRTAPEPDRTRRDRPADKPVTLEREQHLRSAVG